ncbi:MAG: heme lyase CcmF/NrfE family subunit [Deltaproteobacteria bacterium]|nr:heme lyase CcmF/NrfE family subunit [Deltaproteobacteria bacterium]
MAELGHFAQTIAWLLALTGLISGIIAGKKDSTAWIATTRNATMLATVSTLFALYALGYLFYVSDFSVKYVWQFSNRAMESNYKITAIWGGMDGSMLLWCGILTLCAGVVAWRSKHYPRALIPWTLVILNSASLFFLTVVVFYTNPFRFISQPFLPPDGNGLNPLLQNIYMQIHPPSLYMGFTMFTVPYAFCMAALISGRLTNDWIRLTRRWTLIGWGFLTAGIVLGGHWAYLELGWGGFWAWDPVENASFMPWLTATAFLHSVMVQERKNMLKFWNIWLIVLTYGLTVFGTFLTRSGIVQSVHAFAETDVGEVFLQYLAILVILAICLTYYRRKELKPQRQIESLFSREAAFLLNNLLFLSICFATLWGVMFPILSEAVTGTKQTVSIPFFNKVNVPLFLLLLLMMGIGPMIAWKKATLINIKRSFLVPALSSLIVTIILLWAGITDLYPLFSYTICFFVVMTMLVELYRGMKATRAKDKSGTLQATTSLIKRHKTRYGGYLIHLGVVIAAIGITASMAHKLEKEFTISLGESYQIGRFEIKLDDIETTQNDNYQALLSKTSLYDKKSKKLIEELHPEKRFYMQTKETTTEVALRMGLREDFYLALAGYDGTTGKASFKAFVNPLQVWLWIGTLVILAGTGIVLLPDRKRS